MGDGKPFTFAGIWETWRDRAGVEIITCAIITTATNELIKDYHERMPVILEEKVRWRWLEEAPVPELLSMLIPYPAAGMAAPQPVDPKSLYIIR
jgi:putative SOS response-associated peptidase YedK